MRKESKEFLKKYVDNAAPIGFEMNGQRIWFDYIKPYIDSHIVDDYGNVVGIINPDAAYKLVLDAHADEISWIVNDITPKGFLKVVPNGICDSRIALSKRVNIHTLEGIVKGAFGAPPIHFHLEKELPPPKTDNLFVDCGCGSKEEAEELGIQIGNPITYDEGELAIFNNRYLCGRGLDNRIGGFILAEVARMLYEKRIKKNFGIYFVNSIQEELGGKGAAMMSHRIKPDVVIVTEVYHDTNIPTSISQTHGNITCGKGPAIHFGPSIQPTLRKMLLDIAQTHDIRYQIRTAVRSGTNAEAYAYSDKGIPTALISLPQKYMHTSVEMVHLDDLEQMIRLVYEFVITLEDKQSFKLSL